MASNIRDALRGLRGVRFLYLSRLASRTTELSKDETQLPLRDTALLLEAFSKLAATPRSTNLVFDNLSDLVPTLGFDRTYAFLRHAVDILPKDSTSLFLLNSQAHDRSVASAIEGLFNLILATRMDRVTVLRT